MTMQSLTMLAELAELLSCGDVDIVRDACAAIADVAKEEHFSLL